MNIELDVEVFVGDEHVPIDKVLALMDQYRDPLQADSAFEGIIAVKLDGKRITEAQSDPLARLAGLWARKIPWVIGGDTETVALRNSEFCYAFVPAGESIEFSFFSGTESEVDQYVIEPTMIRLDHYVTQSLKIFEKLVQLIRQINPALFEKDEDCRDFLVSLEEAQNAWREHKLHQRR